MYGSVVVAFGLPIDDQILCLDHENEAFLNVYDGRFDFSLERILFSEPTV
jgi:hypothetical protein